MKNIRISYVGFLIAAACTTGQDTPAAGTKALEDAAPSVTSAAAPTSQCLRYEPDTVSLVGQLVVEDKYGPPNFGETPAKDQKLRVPILRLSTPMTVCGDSASVDNRGTVHDVREVQLNLATVRRDAAGLSGKNVAVTGTLYHSFAGEHFTDILMNVANIQSQ